MTQQLEMFEKDSSTYLWGEIQKTQGTLDLVRKKAFAEIYDLRNMVDELKEKLNDSLKSSQRDQQRSLPF